MTRRRRRGNSRGLRRLFPRVRLGDGEGGQVEIIKSLLRLTRNWVETRRVTFSMAPLYGDSLWPWFRCFVGGWMLLLTGWGASIWFEALYASAVAHPYCYGLLRFWVFYIPVFGFFLQKFYVDYTGDGVWTPGTSYTAYLRSSFKDFL